MTEELTEDVPILKILGSVTPAVGGPVLVKVSSNYYPNIAKVYMICILMKHGQSGI